MLGPAAKAAALSVSLGLTFAGSPTIAQAAITPSARAEGSREQPGFKRFLLGVVDDSADLSDAQHRAAVARAGLNAVRGVVHWWPGREPWTVRFDAPPRGVLPVLSVLAPASYAPVTAEDRREYCNFLTEVLRPRPWLRDVMIWNEPGPRSYFWPDRVYEEDNPLTAYAHLLSHCYDQLHAAYSDVRIIGPAAHLPLRELRLLIAALANHIHERGKPLLDIFAVNPYGLAGQTRNVIKILRWALRESPQQIPPIWYTEHGIQSRPPAHKLPLYRGDDPKAVTEAAQALFIKKHVTAAYCTPGVEGYFNFLMRDEPNQRWEGDSAGFQTGLLYPDWMPKPAFTTMRSMASQIRTGNLTCSGSSD